MNIHELLAKDLAREEIQMNLMKNIEIQEKPFKAIVSNGMIEGVAMFGGLDDEAINVFKIPRQQFVENAVDFLGKGDFLTYCGGEYTVKDTPPDMNAPLLSYRAQLD